ncbi:MAG: Fe-S cluster assembly protein SufD [Clostridiales bacterium]|nr:Fe-S cluster assembly protein SufD [Clostridiales bacterium]
MDQEKDKITENNIYDKKENQNEDEMINWQALNPIPVPTWRWLGVNDRLIKGDPISEKSVFPPYQFKILNLSKLDVKVENMNEEKNSHLQWKDFAIDGISQQVGMQVVKQYNSGFYLETKARQKSKEAIQISYEFKKEQNVVVDNNLIHAMEGSELTVIVDYESLDNHVAYHNGLTRIYCEKDAILNYIIVQKLSEESTHLGACIAKLEENATINYIIVELGSKNNITNVRNDLLGNQSSANIHTVYMGEGQRELDINYICNHYGKESKSNIEVKGVLQDQSNKIFKGTLDFKKGAKKAVGQEEEYVVLLSDKVRNRSVPLLLCTEEDVSGQHAASAGRIEEDKLFYLMTRGFSEVQAKKLIVEATIRPVIDRIEEKTLRDAIYEEIRRKINHG